MLSLPVSSRSASLDRICLIVSTITIITAAITDAHSHWLRQEDMRSEPGSSFATERSNPSLEKMLGPRKDLCRELTHEAHQDCSEHPTAQPNAACGASPGTAQHCDQWFETTDEGFIPSKEMAPISQFRLSNVPREFTTGETHPAVSASKSQLTYTVQHNPLETQKFRPRSLVMAIFIPVVVFVLAVAALGALYISKPAPARPLSSCGRQACSQYDALVIDLLNTTADPCDDFYAHVCSAWSLDPTKLSVSKAALTAYRQSLRRLALSQPVPSSNQTAQEKAAKLFTACYNIFDKNVSYVESVRRVMEDAGVPWPHVDSRTDLLHSVFAMAAWPVSVPFQIAFTDEANRTGHLIIVSITLGAFSNHIWKKRDEERRERYFSVLKQYFEKTKYKAMDYNMTLSLEQRIVPALQKSLSKEVQIARTHTRELHKMAPSVPSKAWQRELSVRFNVSVANVTIYGIDFFKAFFELHRTLSEDAMKLYLGWFIVESFLPYTNLHILLEFHGTTEKAREEQTNNCLRLASFAGYALYANYLNNVSDSKMLDQATQVGERIKVAFFDTLKRNSWFGENLISTLEIGHAVGLFDLLGKTGEEDRLPDMTEDALKNLAALSSLKQRWITSITLEETPPWSASRVVMHFPVGGAHVMNDRASPTLALEPYHFAFPFLAEDTPVPAVYAGVGFILARLLFRHLFGGWQRWQSATMDELSERTACIYSSEEATLMNRATKDDIVLATAAISTLWRAFTTAMAPDSNIMDEARGPNSQAATLSEHRLFFVLLCHNRCGDQAGPLLCNVPFRNSEAFVETFSCRPGSPMHAARICPVFS